ncbi:hypothetical protein IAR55_004297 [Kwoniella newhampshirensis]|uniref:Amine oxidase domain-containing protein n=1 Tax=Kwoniella newhampshirensis TaxID=1651941 RepID=A0AAW0YXG4_9TREE
MRVAVIGSGLAGLTTAYLLRREGVEVWLVEKSSKVGFHAESVVVTPSNGETSEEVTKSATVKSDGAKWVVDVPMRGFQGGYYPLLLSLYMHLGIPVKPTNYAYSFTSPSLSTYFIHSGSSGYSIPSLPSSAYTSPFAFVRAIGTFLGTALCYILLIALSFMAWHDFLPSPLSSPNLTLGDFTDHLTTFLSRPITIPIIGYSPWTPLGDIFRSFIDTIVLPLFSAVGTMTSSDVYSLPARVLLEYVHSTLGTDHYHFANGFSAADVARSLSAPIRGQGDGHVRLNTEITGLEYAIGGGVRVTLRTGDREEEGLRVDKVVLATQASVAKTLLRGLEASLKDWGEEKEKVRVGKIRAALEQVQYRETIVITHRDTSILPAEPDQRPINLFLPSVPSSSTPPKSPSSITLSDSPPSEKPATPFFPPSKGIYTMATQIMPSPKGDAESVLQTTNPVVALDPERILGISNLERALPLKRPTDTLNDLRPCSRNALVYLVGSYAYPGIPLLEGCVGSARVAVEGLLASLTPETDMTLHKSATGGKWPMSKIWERTKRGEGVGGIDWEAGRGSKVVRIWRWRRRKGGVWS